MTDAQRNIGGARKAALGVPLGVRREVKSEFGAPGDTAGLPVNGRNVAALRSELTSAAHEPRGPNASEVQGRVVTTHGWPTKTEQSAAEVSLPFNAKVEKAPVVSANPGGTNPTSPVGNSAVDGQRGIMEPMPHPMMIRSSKELSGSDSDFDEPLSDDGSELDGFDAFLENIAKELNDGLYSDLRDEPATRSPQPELVSRPMDQPVVKLEPRSPSRLSSTERLQLEGALDETQNENRCNTTEPDATRGHHPSDVMHNSGEDISSNLRDSAASVAGSPSPRQSAADCAVKTGPSRPTVDDQNTAKLSPPVDSTTELPENTQHARRHDEASIQPKGQPRHPLVDKVPDEANSRQSDDDNTCVPARLCSLPGASLPSDRICEGIKTGAISTSRRSVLGDTEPPSPVSPSTANSSGSTSSCGDKMHAENITETSQTSAGTADDGTGGLEQNVKRHQQDECDAAPHLLGRHSPLEPGEIDASDAIANNFTNAGIESSEAHTNVHSHRMVGRGIRVSSHEVETEITKRGSFSIVASGTSMYGKGRKVISRHSQTDPPKSYATPKATGDLQPPSCPPRETTEARSAKHIDKYCERTFWLLENVSEEFLKEDYSSRTRSILSHAKEVRDGLNRRHGLSLSEQLHLCTNAVRSMLSALRRISKRSSKREASRRSREEVEENNKKPTEVVQPYSAAQNHIGRPPAESTSPSETPLAAQGRLSPHNEPPTGISKTNPNSIKESETASSSSDGLSSPVSSGMPPPPFLTDMTEGREQTVSSREKEKTAVESVPLPEETKNDSVWASRLFSAPRKRMIEDGYGLSFLDNLRDRQAANAVFSTALRRVVEKFRLVCDHRARLPDIVRKNIPGSLKWQDVWSIRLKSELFTGFGIFLENVADLQDEFLPLNPFQINLLPPKELPTTAYGGVAQKQGVPHVPQASPEVGFPSGEAWHPSDRFGPAYGGGAPRSGGAWEEACQHFLEKIWNKTPTKADALNQIQCGERPPSPAAFVDVNEGREEPSHKLRPLPFLSIVPTDSYLSYNQAADVSPPGVPRARYLVPVPSAPELNSAPASSAVNNVPVCCNVNMEDSDMSISEGEDKITNGTPPPRVSPVTGGDPASDVGPERAPSRPSSDRASATPADEEASGNRCSSSGPGTSDSSLKVDAQQAAQKILREGLNLLGQPLTTPSSSNSPAHAKRRRRGSDEGSCEAERRNRRKSESTFSTNVKLDRLLRDGQDSKHEDPWERFLHLSTRDNGSSTVVCPLCDDTYLKAEILSHAKSVHRIRPPGRSNSGGPAGSSTSGKASRRVTNAERSRHRSPSGDSPSRRKTSKRSRHQSPEGRSRRRTDHRPTSKERSRRSSEEDRRHPTRRHSASRERSRDDLQTEIGGEGADGKKELSRHSSGSSGSRQRSSGEGSRDCSSPNRASRNHGKERSSKRRPGSPHRSSHTNTKRERRDVDGKQADSVLDQYSSEASSEGSRPIENFSNPRHSSPPSHPPKMPEASPAGNSAAGEDEVSALNAPSVDSPASHTTAEELHISSEAKLKSRMTEVEPQSKTTEGKSQHSSSTQMALKESVIPQDSTIDSLPTRSGFDKDEWQTALSKLKVILSTVRSVARDGKTTPCSAQDPQPKEPCAVSTPDEEAHYIAVINDEQCSSDEHQTTPRKGESTKDSANVGVDIALPTALKVKKGSLSHQCAEKTQPESSPSQPDEQSTPVSAAKQPQSKRASHVAATQVPKGEQQMMKPHQSGQVRHSAVSSEVEMATGTLDRQKGDSTTTTSRPMLAETGTATSKQDKRDSLVPQSKQQNVKRRESRPNLVKIQPQKPVQKSKKAKKRGSDHVSNEPQMTKPKVATSDNHATRSDSKNVKVSQRQRKKRKKENLLDDSESAVSKPENDRAKANGQQTSDAFRKGQLPANETQVVCDVPEKGQQDIQRPSETPDKGAHDSVKASSKPERESPEEQKGSREAEGGTEPSKSGASDEAKTSSTAACSVKPGTITHRCSLCCDVLDSLPALRAHEEACIKRRLPGIGERCPSCRQLISNQLRHRTGCRTQCARCGKIGLHRCLAKLTPRGPPPPAARPFQPITPQPAVPQVPAGWTGQAGGGVWRDRRQVWGPVCRQLVPQPAWRGPRVAPVWCVHCGGWGALHRTGCPQTTRPGAWR